MGQSPSLAGRPARQRPAASPARFAGGRGSPPTDLAAAAPGSAAHADAEPDSTHPAEAQSAAALSYQVARYESSSALAGEAGVE